MRKTYVQKLAIALLIAAVLAATLGVASTAAFHGRTLIRIFAGPNTSGETLWTLWKLPFQRQPTWWVYRGLPNSYYFPDYTLTPRDLFRGPNLYGSKIATFRNDTLYLGANTSAPALFRLVGGRIFEGRNTSGPIRYTTRGKRIYAGRNTSGEIVANASIVLSQFQGRNLELVTALLLSGELEEPQPRETPTPPPPPLP